MSSAVPDGQRRPPLAGQLVVFTGKLSSLGRKDAHALVVRLGGATADDVNAKTTMLVVGAEGFGPAPNVEDATGQSSVASSFSRTVREKSHKLTRAEELNAQRSSSQPIQILTEEEFCRLADVPSPDTLKRQYYSVRDVVARYRALREDRVRYLMKCGVLRPVVRTNADTFFAFPDLAVIKQANDGLAQGIAFRGVVRALIAARQGQLAFDFRLDAAPAKIITLRRPEGANPAAAPPKIDGRIAERDTALAEEYFRAASALDEGDDSTQDEAAAAYREAAGFLRGAFQPRQHLPRSRPVRRRADMLPRGVAAEPVLRRRALLPRGHIREDGAVAGSAPALAQLSAARAAGGMDRAGQGILGVTVPLKADTTVAYGRSA